MCGEWLIHTSFRCEGRYITEALALVLDFLCAAECMKMEATCSFKCKYSKAVWRELYLEAGSGSIAVFQGSVVTDLAMERGIADQSAHYMWKLWSVRNVVAADSVQQPQPAQTSSTIRRHS